MNLYVAVAAAVLLSVVDGRYRTSRNEVWPQSLYHPHYETTCHQLLKYIHDKDIISPHPSLALDGRWTSTSCEQRPGPQFVVRDYVFSENATKFQLTQYFYSNSQCDSPLYAVSARGELHLSLSHSFLIPGATETDYHSREVVVTPYTPDMAEALAHTITSTSCSQHLETSRWRPYKPTLVLRDNVFTSSSAKVFETFTNDVETEARQQSDFDCTIPLHIALHELQLMRIEISQMYGGGRKLLYMGDQHTEIEEQMYYRPTAYQPALLPAKSMNCVVCQRVKSSNLLNPPRLFLNIRYLRNIDGSWASVHCETRPNGMFLTRRLHFASVWGTWKGSYHYYLDELCQHPSFTLHVNGKFKPSNDSMISKMGSHILIYEFKTRNIKLKVEDSKTVRFLNQAKHGECGSGIEWKEKEERDVTQIGGCQLLGLHVPRHNKDICKVEVDSAEQTWLYMGQVATRDGGSSGNKVASSFQSPLKSCSHDTRSMGLIQAQSLVADETFDSIFNGSTDIIGAHNLILFIISIFSISISLIKTKIV